MIHSLWHNISNTEIREIPEPVNINTNQCCIFSKYSMISTGTEKLVITKNIPKTIQEDMKVPYQKGDFNLPISYGYALSGTLENGTKVHLMHPHQNKCIVDKTSVFDACQELPQQRIPLISNIETVINAIWDSEINENSKAVVCGFGNIGSLLAVTLKYHYNIDVKIIEHNVWKQKKAIEFGFEIYDEEQTFNMAFNTTANENVLQYCIDHIDEEGKIIELSWYGKATTTLQLGAKFHKNRLQLIASQVSKIPLKMRQEFDYYKRKVLAVSILKNNIFDKLITHIIPFSEAPIFFDSLRKNKIPDGLIYLIKY